MTPDQKLHKSGTTSSISTESVATPADGVVRNLMAGLDAVAESGGVIRNFAVRIINTMFCFT